MLKETYVEIPQQSTEDIEKLQSIADSIHNCHKSATKAKIAGTLIETPGRILSIAGLFTHFFSPDELLMLTTMGGLAGLVGGAICLMATAFDHCNQFSKRNQENVKEIVRSYQEAQAMHADKLLQVNQAVQAFNQIKAKNISDKAILGMLRILLDLLSIMFGTILMIRRLTGILAVYSVWCNISSIKKNRKELGKKIEIVQMIQKIAENMED